MKEGRTMTAGQITRGAIALAALAALGAGSLARAAEPSIPLRVSLVIPETCTIDTGAPQAAADAGMPSVSCMHGTPFVLSHAALPDARQAPRGIGTGAPSAWTVTF
ncbi:hypothetical protein WK90_11140 [Burkholderia cepacia]|nr:hypothetical protein WK83_13035 [Burkholderia cepacia]KVV60851.1 hypothetical protein WK84_03485 [Burkholderia cepacia]KVV74172.1 hypothetical protein WK86_32045 [Burkholderia cepacia]KVV75281.1 hypothetical protein WK85_11145 [Burkholderia cepacia]KVV82195.1 hypothetical protein WK88_05255 [Burkholderia cepacia]